MTPEEQLGVIIKRAQAEKVLFQELLIELFSDPLPEQYMSQLSGFDFDNIKKWSQDDVGKAIEILKPYVAELVARYKREVDEVYRITKQKENAHFKRKDPSAKEREPVHTAWRIQIMRDLPGVRFFTEALMALSLQERYPDHFAGLDVVGPEHSQDVNKFKNLRRILQILRQRFTKNDFEPNIALHIGELTTAQSAPSLCNSSTIAKTVEKLQPRAISHLISDTQNTIQYLEHVKRYRVLLEICHVSNACLNEIHVMNSPWHHCGLAERIFCEDDPEVFKTSPTDTLFRAINDGFLHSLADVFHMQRTGAAHSLYGESIYVDSNTLDDSSEMPLRQHTKLRSMFAENRFAGWTDFNAEAQVLLDKSPRARLQVRLEAKLFKRIREWAMIWDRAQKYRQHIPPEYF